MKAKLEKASNTRFGKKIEVNSIADCLKLYDRVIIRKADGWDVEEEGFEDIDIVITIYDDYVE